ncbi:hypothetical protein FQV27_05390 [Paracoccus aurantiacus]|uniref:Uncharacterized protein n=1 Tax=Paracoccus aurantiacus TaxID=2599412 RepID=A0A5C6SBS7_9RHOB|nr:hypothetical protein [Paracoccus aurantiacus]TXB71273.1 hypothetical protein FQV27_05390 [Paracoccus aurantiacus]
MLIRNSFFTLAAAAALLGASLIGNATLGDELHKSAGKVTVGEAVEADEIHLISHPGRYGLGPDLSGSRYAIVSGMLVRINPKTLKVQSVIRRVEKILD